MAVGRGDGTYAGRRGGSGRTSQWTIDPELRQRLAQEAQRAAEEDLAQIIRPVARSPLDAPSDLDAFYPSFSADETSDPVSYALHHPTM